MGEYIEQFGEKIVKMLNSILRNVVHRNSPFFYVCIRMYIYVFHDMKVCVV